VLVGGDDRMVKVHVHNERPDEVISYGLSLGTLTRITIENLDSMARRRARGAGGGVRRRGDGYARRPRRRGRNGTVAVATQPAVSRSTELVGTGRLAPSANGARGGCGCAAERSGVDEDSAGDRRRGRRRRPREAVPDFGVSPHRPWGPDRQPEHRRAAADRPSATSRGDPLPNNPNVRFAAEQAAGSARTAASSSSRPGTRPRASPRCSRSIADLDAAANVEPMTAAGRGLATVQVTEAVRDAKIGGRRSGRARRSRSTRRRARRGRRRPRSRGPEGGRGVPGGVELVTLYYGEDATLLEAEAIARSGSASGSGATSRSSTAASRTTAT
jgi:hypothetical protein